MTKRSSAPARALAAIAVVGGFIVVLAVVGATLGGGSEDSGTTGRGEVTHEAAKPKTKAAYYVIEIGDTLTAIAHKTGVTIARIQELNPGVDPQILISGEKLKLR